MLINYYATEKRGEKGGKEKVGGNRGGEGKAIGERVGVKGRSGRKRKEGRENKTKQKGDKLLKKFRTNLVEKQCVTQEG